MPACLSVALSAARNKLMLTAVWGMQVCKVRDAVISRLLPVGNFLDHTLFDCGSLA